MDFFLIREAFEELLSLMNDNNNLNQAINTVTYQFNLSDDEKSYLKDMYLYEVKS